MIRNGLLMVLILVGVLILDAQEAQAIRVNIGTRGFYPQFNNPGARANGMGGAFVAVADDATAAYTNPAGLTIISQPEVAIEYKNTSYEYTHISALYDPLFPVDTVNSYKSENQIGDVSFLSLAYPTKNVVYTIYRQSLIQTDTEETYAYLDSSSVSGYSTRTFRLLFDVKTTGISGAMKVGDRLSVGLGIAFAELRRQSSSVEEDSKTAASIGLLWNPTDSFSIGATYKYGPDFDYLRELGSNPYNREHLKIPDIYSLGIAFRPSNSLTLTTEVNFIQYSQILEDPIYQNSTQVTDSDPSILSTNYSIDDGVDVRAGLEYVFSIHDIPCAVRAGYHLNPQHTIYYEQEYSSRRDQDLATMYPKLDDEHIGSFGFGFAPNESIQFDFSGSWSNVSEEYTVSIVNRF